MMKKIQKGFTLIELMIVIAIIGILAAIAIPAYQDYVTRSQVTEGMSLAAGLKTQIAEFHANAGLWPDGIDDLPANVDGTPRAPEDVSGKYVFSVTITQGTMEILYGNDANANVSGKTVALQPFLNANGDVIWRCGNANDPEGASNNSTLQLDGNESIPGTTDVLDKYMPANCRTGATVTPTP